MKFVSLRILRRTNTDDRTNLIRTKNLISSELVSDLSNVIKWNKLEWITEVFNGLFLGSSCLGQEGSLHGLGDRSQHWLNSPVVVVQHCLFVGRAVHDLFRQT